MKRRLTILGLAAAVALSSFAQLSSYTWGGEADDAVITFDAYGLEDDGIYRKYADTFNESDIRLELAGSDLDRISSLRQFDFQSLALTIIFPDTESYEAMKPVKELLFPEATQEVVVLCGDEPYVLRNDAMENFIISLWVCCPQATLNGREVQELAQEILADDSYGMAQVYESNARLNLLFDQAMEQQLDTLEGEPEYNGKLIFMVYDDVSISSQESIAAGEPFFSVPSSYLADGFSEADTAIYIYPVRSVMGMYANGGEAICTYTRVLVADLDQMKMYEAYTAVRNDPPESIEILNDNGAYSTEGAQGAYEPKAALNQILTSGKIHPEKQGKKTDAKESEKPANTADNTTEKSSEKLSAASTSTDGNHIQKETATAAMQQSTSGSNITMSTSISPEFADLVERKEPSLIYDTNEWLTQDLLYRMFDALGDDLYKQVYEALKTNKDLASGSKGNLALGLQKTLIAFGQNISADSLIGSATMNSLNQVLTSLGQDRTTKVSSKIYASMMPGLLMYTDPEAAQKILADIFPEDPGALEYLRACILYLDGYYFQAREAFEESAHGDFEERMQDCVQDMPATGVVYRDTELAGNEASVTIQIYGYDDLAANCIMIYNEEGTLVSCLVIRGTGNASVNLKAGKYRILDGTGYRWYGIRDMFGEDGSYEEIVFDGGLPILEIKSGYDYSIIFNAQEHSDASQGLGSEDVSWEDVANLADGLLQ